MRSRTWAGVLLLLVTAAASAGALGSASAAEDAAPLRWQEQPAKPVPLDVSEMEGPAPLNWRWEVEQTLSSRGPGAVPAEQHGEALQQAAQRSSSVMAAALARDIQQVQAAAAAATKQARAAAPVQAEARTAPGFTFAIGFSRNESTIALSSSPFNATERGAFDIRAGWARSRRMVRLPGNTGAVQEVVQTELFLSVSGLALLCIGVGVLLLVLAACMPSSGDSGDVDDTDGDAEDQRAAFIKDNGYTKL
ncbi:hypothetical protein ABPG75_000849 [Micractinium tetrahymenae]